MLRRVILTARGKNPTVRADPPHVEAGLTLREHATAAIRDMGFDSSNALDGPASRFLSGPRDSDALACEKASCGRSVTVTTSPAKTLLVGADVEGTGRDGLRQVAHEVGTCSANASCVDGDQPEGIGGAALVTEDAVTSPPSTAAVDHFGGGV